MAQIVTKHLNFNSFKDRSLSLNLVENDLNISSQVAKQAEPELTPRTHYFATKKAAKIVFIKVLGIC